MNPDIHLQKKFTMKIKRGGPSGSYGMYIQLTKKLGVKVINGDYSTRELAIEYGVKDAIEEARVAKKVRRIYKNSPKCYGVRVFRAKDRYYAGILLQHLGNKRLWDVNVSSDDIIKTIRSQMSKKGVSHWDLHSKNIMFFKGRFYAIDMYSASIIKNK